MVNTKAIEALSGQEAHDGQSHLDGRLAGDVNEGGRQIAPDDAAGLHAVGQIMQQAAETAAAGQPVKAEVGEGGEAAAGREMRQHVVQNGLLQAARKGRPGQAADDGVEFFSGRQNLAEIKLLRPGALEVHLGETRGELLDEGLVQLNAEVVGPVRHGV